MAVIFKYRIPFFLFLGIAFIVGACNESNDRLTAVERQTVDTLYTQEVRHLRPRLDSICKESKDSLIRVAADSMIKVRLDEMERILKRK